MYNPSGFYGFYIMGDGEEFQFHANRFQKLFVEGPPPIVGEALCVCGELVRRVSPPPHTYGVVISFDSKRGWGFIEYGNSSSRAFLHLSDCLGVWLPQIGKPVKFYEGFKNGRSRACWVTPCG